LGSFSVLSTFQLTDWVQEVAEILEKKRISKKVRRPLNISILTGDRWKSQHSEVVGRDILAVANATQFAHRVRLGA
jgi:hypothetical protein